MSESDYIVDPRSVSGNVIDTGRCVHVIQNVAQFILATVRALVHIRICLSGK